jgi:hypothetical protein
VRPAWDSVDHLLALDPGGRGIAAFFTPGAARDAAEALQRATRVLLTTGFAVAEHAPETDGPPGTAVLGRALRRLGARVSYVTDPVNVPLLEATLKILDEPADIEVYPEGPDAAAAVARRLRPTHMVAIERPGRGRGGDYLNARGASVAAWNRPIDELFISVSKRALGSGGGWPGSGGRGSASRGQSASCGQSASRGQSASGGQPASGGGWPGSGGRGSARPVTVGVGDGGNEIGMGKVRARLVRQGALMARIASVVATDHLVAAGTSNWGAYGIVAQLARLTGEPLLHAPATERRLIAACVEAGAIDGISRRPEPTVDGLSLDVHAAFVEMLGMAVRQPRPAPGVRV